MPHVSRLKLSERVEQELMATFAESLVLIHDRELARQVMDDLFTPTEKLMLGKRMLIAVLLQQGFGYRDIMRALKVTAGTVNSVKITLGRSGVGLKGLFQLLAGHLQAQEGRRRREERQERLASKLVNVFDALHLPAKGSRRDMVRWRRALERLA